MPGELYAITLGLDPDAITLEEHRRLSPDRPAPITPRPKPPPPPPCVVDGCDREANSGRGARGLCGLHYQRWRAARRRARRAIAHDPTSPGHHGGPTPREPRRRNP